MFRKIAGTIGTRFGAALITFAAMTLNARYLDPEKVGTISLVVFSVAVVQLLTNFVAGAGLVYYTPRKGISRLILPAYLWSVVMSFAGTGILLLAGNLFPAAALIPEGYARYVLLLSLVISLAGANSMFLLGGERIARHNALNLLQVALLLGILLFMFFFLHEREVRSYLAALLASYTVSFAAGLFSLLPSLRRVPAGPVRQVVGDLLKFGSFVQFANLFQTLNYRLSLKFTDHFLGRGSVGILSVGMQLAEGLWLISRSVATVQFSRLSNTSDHEYGNRLTLTLMKIVFLVTALAMALLLAIPEAAYAWLFTGKFAGVKSVIASLSGGIVALSVSIILSGYFSGINKPWHNLAGSAAGFLFTLLFGLWLVPAMGITGAGVAATLSYCAITGYQLWIFIRMTGIRARDFLVTRREVTLFLGEIRRAAGRES